MFRQMSRPGVRGVVGGTGNLRLRCETANIIADSVLTTCVAVWCVVCGAGDRNIKRCCGVLLIKSTGWQLSNLKISSQSNEGTINFMLAVNISPNTLTSDHSSLLLGSTDVSRVIWDKILVNCLHTNPGLSRVWGAKSNL